ncbi:cupin domain-containing protein [Candidatus Beckwithbacteria bacterium]|nr:cupin domain-containing protein [Candidatus Beckwithbacteria bacterium]
MVNWAKLPVGSSFSAHYHETMQEIFIITKGKVKIIVDGKAYILQEKDLIVADPKEIHEMQNIDRQDVEYLVFGISQGIEGRTVVE